MLYYNRSDVSEGIHFNKTSASKIYYLSIIYYYWYFLDKEYKFQSLFCNGDNINNLSCII